MSNFEQLRQTEQRFDSFAESEYGQLLVSRTRWDVFKPDFVDTETWTTLLGEDVNNLYHMKYTEHLARKFCELGNLDPATTDLLTTTAITHDIGEAIIGDIPLPDKTEADEKLEFVAYRKIASELWADGDQLADKVIPVLSHENKEAGDMFRAIEYIGYCTTARRASIVAESIAHGFINLNVSRSQKEQLMGGLLGLHKAVSVHNYPTLTEYIKKYPQAGQVYWEEVMPYEND